VCISRVICDKCYLAGLHWPNLTLPGELAIINRHYECAARMRFMVSVRYGLSLRQQISVPTIGIDQTEINRHNTEFHT